MLLRWVARRVDAAVAAELADHGLSRNAFCVLVVLAEIRHRAGLSVQSLVEKAAVDRASIGEVLNELEEEGLITREDDPEDRRARLAAITRAGKEATGDLVERVARAEAAALRPLSARERERIRVLLERTLPPPRATLWDLLR